MKGKSVFKGVTRTSPSRHLLCLRPPCPVLAPPRPSESRFSLMTRAPPPASTLLSPGGPTVPLGPTAPGDAGTRRAEAAQVHTPRSRDGGDAPRSDQTHFAPPLGRPRGEQRTGPCFLHLEHQGGGPWRPRASSPVSSCGNEGGRRRRVTQQQRGHVTAVNRLRSRQGSRAAQAP